MAKYEAIAFTKPIFCAKIEKSAKINNKEKKDEMSCLRIWRQQSN